MGVDIEKGEEGRAGVVPVTYINSSADIKAFCGEHGGIVCTSTNAAAIMTWAWQQADKLVMLPDQHLGRNTAFKMGVPLDRMVIWDPNEVWGGLDARAGQGREADSVEGPLLGPHALHRRADRRLPQEVPGGKVIAHPECTFDVVQAADVSGSTEHIINTVRSSPSGSIWAVATEIHLVNRLKNEVEPDKTVVTLDPFGCLCSTMFRVSPNHLLWVLEGLVEGKVYNQITVAEPQKSFARLALDRMLTGLVPGSAAQLAAARPRNELCSKAD